MKLLPLVLLAFGCAHQTLALYRNVDFENSQTCVEEDNIFRCFECIATNMNECWNTGSLRTCNGIRPACLVEIERNGNGQMTSIKRSCTNDYLDSDRCGSDQLNGPENCENVQGVETCTKCESNNNRDKCRAYRCPNPYRKVKLSHDTGRQFFRFDNGDYANEYEKALRGCEDGGQSCEASYTLSQQLRLDLFYPMKFLFNKFRSRSAINLFQSYINPDNARIPNSMGSLEDDQTVVVETTNEDADVGYSSLSFITGSSKAKFYDLVYFFCVPKNKCLRGERERYIYNDADEEGVQVSYENDNTDAVSPALRVFRGSGQSYDVPNWLEVNLPRKRHVIVICIQILKIRKIILIAKSDNINVYEDEITKVGFQTSDRWTDAYFPIKTGTPEFNRFRMEFQGKLGVSLWKIRRLYLVICVEERPKCPFPDRKNRYDTDNRIGSVTIDEPYEGEDWYSGNPARVWNAGAGNQFLLLYPIGGFTASVVITLPFAVDVVGVKLVTRDFLELELVMYSTETGDPGTEVYGPFKVWLNGGNDQAEWDTDLSVGVRRLVFQNWEANGEPKLKGLKIYYCEDETCICRIRGDPIVETCDMELIFLQGEGYFLMAGYTSGAIGADACDTEFRVFVKTENRAYLIPVEMIIKVKYDGVLHTVVIDENDDVFLDGIEITTFPSTDGPLTFLDDAPFKSVTINNCGRFSFAINEPSSKGRFAIDSSLQGVLGGLCGDFDGVAANDKVLQNGTASENMSDISDSWREDDAYKKK